MTQSPPTTPQAMPEKPATIEPSCNFCGKRQSEVECMVAGPYIYICNECVDLCNHFIEKERADLAQPRAVEKVEDLNGLAHVIWAASQLMPDEGIIDGVSRIVTILQAARIVAAQQKKAIDPLAGTPDGVCS